MTPKSSLTTPKCFLIFLFFLSLLALYLTSTLHSSPNHPPPQFNVHFSQESLTNSNRLPNWYKFLAQEFIGRKMRIGLLNTRFQDGLLHGENVDIVDVKFQRVSEKIEWDHLFPEWINENDNSSTHKCAMIPIPELEEYCELDVVVARAPCRSRNMRDVYRLQVNLIVANLLVRCGWDDKDILRTVYAVFIGECEPMIEIFRCDDVLWQQEDAKVYKPNVKKLKQKVVMPVGSCELARPFVEPGKKKGRRYSYKIEEPKQAYVTVLHSSETYVCGAIVLAQSIKQSKSSKDLVLLADSSISPKSLRGLQAAGWTVKMIQRIRSSQAARGAYNEWNYSKLRIWEQLVEYDKVVFVDSDVVLVKNMDEFFLYPELSASKNDGHFFNSGVMVVEPSMCTFKILMKKRHEVVSYNGGDQGFLNEMFVWWHRLPTSANRLKVFAYNYRSNRHEIIPDDVYTIHYLGLKPWTCKKDNYDCNWDKLEYQKYASDPAHKRWWQVYKKMPKRLQEFCALSQ